MSIFNSAQAYWKQNAPIKLAYDNSDAVVFQSEFNKKLTERYFGEHDNSHVIHNGTDLEMISQINPMPSQAFDDFDSVWCCASSWRPHKRLSENVRYFLEVSSPAACLVIAGENPDHTIAHPRIFYAGDLPWETLISLYKRAHYFIHLSWLDHCPNVVIDARACGCHIICSSSGGTKEIAGTNSTIIQDDDWDLSPIRLYHPPKMDFSLSEKSDIDNSFDIEYVIVSHPDFLNAANRLANFHVNNDN